MKSILFVLVMVAAQFANAKEAKAVKVSAVEVLNAIIAPVQSEIASGKVTDIASAVELNKYMEFLSSGNTIDLVEKDVDQDTTYYTMRIRDCHNNGKSCSRSSTLYVVSISVVNGNKVVSSLVQRN